MGVGAAFATYLRGGHGTARLMADVLRRRGLPVVARELGFSDEEFVGAVGFAPETRPGRYTILEHLALSPSDIGTAYAAYVTAVAGRPGRPV
ncbi:hypothetical protein BIV23_33505 [Streptomyces monashensis]|uniref:Uncharacterized protein n=1 Tax=Streptomyces monashensis TaxID=1678012 RepID=A0A1S2PQF6_9ACTN|nr:hypothetical protein BIV23_33505 [Streptomyces monashensis]